MDVVQATIIAAVGDRAVQIFPQGSQLCSQIDVYSSSMSVCLPASQDIRTPRASIFTINSSTLQAQIYSGTCSFNPMRHYWSFLMLLGPSCQTGLSVSSLPMALNFSVYRQIDFL